MYDHQPDEGKSVDLDFCLHRNHIFIIVYLVFIINITLNRLQKRKYIS